MSFMQEKDGNRGEMYSVSSGKNKVDAILRKT